MGFNPLLQSSFILCIQGLGEHLWCRKNAAGPGIAQGAFVLRCPAIDQVNHNTRTANSSRRGLRGRTKVHRAGASLSALTALTTWRLSPGGPAAPGAASGHSMRLSKDKMGTGLSWEAGAVGSWQPLPQSRGTRPSESVQEHTRDSR